MVEIYKLKYTQFRHWDEDVVGKHSWKEKKNRRTARKFAIQMPPIMAQRFERDISRGPSLFPFFAESSGPWTVS